MKFYIKNEKGDLVEATSEQTFNRDLKLFYEDGKEFIRPSMPNIITDSKNDDPVVQLTSLITDLTSTIKGQNNVKDEVEKMKQELAAYKEMSKRGFVIPSTQVPSDAPMASQYGKGCLERVNLAVQGKKLTDQIFYPRYQLSEKSRLEVATYLCRVLKAAQGDHRGFDEIRSEYKSVPAFFKTTIGDTGNTFPIPDVVEAEILAFAREVSLAMQYARSEIMTSDKQSFPSESASASVSWGESTSSSTPNVTEVELDSEVLSAYATAKQTTLDDSPSDIVTWIFQNMYE